MHHQTTKDTHATLEQLGRVRSQLAERLELYLEHFAGLGRLPEQPESPWLGERSLAQVYIDPVVIKEKKQSDRKPNRDHEPEEEEERGERVRWKREWRRGRRFFLVGEAGTGKTTLTRLTMQWEAQQSLAALQNQTRSVDELVFPVWVSLGAVAKHGLNVACRKAVAWVFEASRQSLGNDKKLDASPERAVDYILRTIDQQRRCLFLDGLDEVPEMLTGKLEEKLKSAGDARGRVVFTARPYARGDLRPQVVRAAVYQLASLDQRDCRRFISAWFGDAQDKRARQLREAVQGNPAFGQLARNAMLLTIACAVAERPGLPACPLPVDLLHLGVDEALRRMERQSPLPVRADDVQELRRLLPGLAWELFRKDPQARLFAEEAVQVVLKRCCVRQNQRKQVLRQLEQSGLLTKEASGRERIWLHKRLLEYLAAEHVARQADPIQLIEPFLWQQRGDGGDARQPAAAEMITFVAGCLGHPEIAPDKNPNLFLRYLLDFEEKMPNAMQGMSLLSAKCRCNLPDARANVELSLRIIKNVTTGKLGHRSESLHCLAFAEAIDHFSREVKSNAFRRGLTARKLGDIGSERAVDLLLEWLDPAQEPNPHNRRHIAWALGVIGSERPVDRLLERLDRKHEPDADVREEMAGALGAIGSERNVDRLLERLDPAQESDARVREVMARALGAIGSERAVHTLLKRLDARLEPAAFVREEMARALGEIGCEWVVDPLLKRLDRKRESDAGVRGCIAIALGAIGSERAVDPMLERLDSAQEFDAHVRGWVAWALGTIGSKRAVEPLLEHLDYALEPDAGVRKAVAKALGDIGSERAVDTVLERLDPAVEPVDFVREDMARALGAIDSERAVEALLKRLDPAQETDAFVRRAMATALGAVDSERAVYPLLQRLDRKREPDAGVRGCIAIALGDIGSDRVLEALLKRLDPVREPDATVRENIARALGAINCGRVVDALRKRLDPTQEPDATIREAMAQGLRTVYQEFSD